MQGGEQNAYRVSVGDLNGRDKWEDLGTDWKISMNLHRNRMEVNGPCESG